MGYAFSVYAVDLARLKAVWGSLKPAPQTKAGKSSKAKAPKPDPAARRLLAAIKRSNAAHFVESDESFEEVIAEGAPTLETALEELFAGRAKSKDFGFQYGYALELVCQKLGKRIDTDEFSWFDEFLDPLLEEAKQPVTNTLLRSGTFPLAIPPPDDFPEIGTLDDKAMTKLLKSLDKLEVEEDSDEAQIVEELRTWVKRARKLSRGIVWFIY